MKESRTAEAHHTEIFFKHIQSTYLDREVALTVILPPGYGRKPYPVLWLNDGQDIPAIQLTDSIEELYKRKLVRHFIVVGVHANENRIYEYGTSTTADFKNRGNKAGLYAEFFINELVPYIRDNYSVSRNKLNNVIAGWSLGGLSAIDIAWNYPDFFTCVGVFSGSLWWRMKAYNRGYKDDKHRIIHQQIKNSEKRPGMKFWFECGTMDETSDRNKNGVIDSIDDTVDLIKILKAKGYENHEDIQFVLVKGGEHNQQTWAEIMPYFLTWGFPVKS